MDDPVNVLYTDEKHLVPDAKRQVLKEGRVEVSSQPKKRPFAWAWRWRPAADQHCAKPGEAWSIGM